MFISSISLDLFSTSTSPYKLYRDIPFKCSSSIRLEIADETYEKNARRSKIASMHFPVDRIRLCDKLKKHIQ